MQVKSKTQDFQPITLEIVIESRDELLEMYHRLNAAAGDIERGSSGAKYPSSWHGTYELYDFLESEVEKLGETT